MAMSSFISNIVLFRVFSCAKTCLSNTLVSIFPGYHMESEVYIMTATGATLPPHASEFLLKAEIRHKFTRKFLTSRLPKNLPHEFWKNIGINPKTPDKESTIAPGKRSRIFFFTIGYLRFYLRRCRCFCYFYVA
jgi:hypothetical protein